MRYITEVDKWDQPPKRAPTPQIAPSQPRPFRAAIRSSRQRPTKARFSRPSASFRRVPCRRSVAFHFVTACHGSPTLRASALPIARRMRFQSMKTEGSEHPPEERHGRDRVGAMGFRSRTRGSGRPSPYHRRLG